MSENQKRLHVQHYYSTNKNSVPEVKVEGVENENALIDGEIAINHADEKLFIKKNGATVSNDVVTFSSDEKLDERYAPKKDYVVNGENEGGVHIDTGGDPTMGMRPVIHMGEFEYNTNGGYDSANGIGILVEEDIESSGLIVESGYVNLTGETETCSSSTGGGRVELFSETVKLTTWNEPCEGDTFLNTLMFNKDGLNVEIDNLEGDFKNFSVNKDGLTFDNSRVVTEQILGEHDELVKVDENGVANKSELTIGSFEIKNDKPYNYTFEGVYSSEERLADEDINIIAEYNHERPKLKSIDGHDVWCYEFIVTEFSLDEGDPEEYFEEASSIIGLVLNIPAAFLDSDYEEFEEVKLLNFIDDKSEILDFDGSTDEDSNDIRGYFIRTVPFSLKHTSKVLLNGSPIVTDKKLGEVTGVVETVLGKVDAIEKSLGTDGDTGKAIAAAQSAADNAQKEVDALEKSVASEIARVESEVEDNYLRKVADDNSSNFITFQEALFSVDLDTPACSSTLKYELISSGDGETPSLTIDGKEIATHDYVKEIASGGIRFRGIYTELPWDGTLSVSMGEVADFEIWEEENLQGFSVGDLIIVAPKHEEEYNEQYGGNPSADPSKEYILTKYETDDAYHYHWELLGETTVVDKRITDEINRAKGEEIKLNTAINGEISRAVAKENELLGKINANTTAISNKADKSEIPTKTSQLTNDSNYVDKTYVDNSVVNSVVIVKGDKDNSAVLSGEYEGYSNKAISQVSVAVGAASTSGLKGWYYDAITFDDTNNVYKIYIKYQNKLANGTGLTTSNNTTTQPKTISTSSGSTNSSFKSGYEVGDVISLVNDKKYEDCSTITAINGNVLTVDKLPFAKSDMKTSSLASIVGYEAIDEFSIYCIKRDFNDTLKTLTLSKYDKGDVDFGGGSLSEGVQTYAVNIGAHAEGAQTVAKGQYSHTEGIRTIANYASHAEGGETIASGSRSHAEGYKNEASGDYSHVEGDNNVASGVSSHAEGYNTRATDNQSHAEGGSTNATGKQSHAEGWSTTASGLHAHAEGGYTIASAWNSHAGGNYSEAIGNNSFAHGDHVIANSINGVAFGKYNDSSDNTLFSIGNGTNENERFNAFEINKNDNDEINAFVSGKRILVEGDIAPDTSCIKRNSNSSGIIDVGCIYKDEELVNVAKGYASISLGAAVLSKSDGAISIGWSDSKGIAADETLSSNDDYLNKWKELTNITDESVGSTTQAGFSASLGNNAVSLGRNNLSVGPQSTAIGMRNLAIGNHAVALGGYNIARGHNSVAMGQGCITNNTGSGSSNRGEFACGRFNKSVSDTQFSIGIGTSATKRKNALEIKTNGNAIFSGNVTASAFYESSDERLKIFKSDIVVDLDKLAELRKSYFTFVEDPGTNHLGVSAQEIKELYPEIVTEGSDGFLKVDYAKLSVVALKAVDILNAKNKELEERLARIEKALNLQ